MGRGDLAKVRDARDRGRKKKEREKRQAAERAAARNGPSANASPRSNAVPREADAIKPNRLRADPLRFPFASSPPSTLACRNIAWGSHSSTVTTHGPIAIGT